MSILRRGFVLYLGMVAPLVLGQLAAQGEKKAAIQPEAWRLVLLANAARNEQGIKPLWWDSALAEAARQHCLRMAAEGPIAHQYNGEADVSERAKRAGAHFSLIEENVAIGPDPRAIHNGWMNSKGHRDNLLNPDVDRIGVAVVASRGVLYAVADYERVVAVLSQIQVETQVKAAIAALTHSRGVSFLRDSTVARAACATDRGSPRSNSGPQPSFIMRWQDADLTHLPQALTDRLASGAFRQAAVGSCPAQGANGAFTAYRVAVLLYGERVDAN